MKAGCLHRWVIETPTPGRVHLNGVCKLCGDERDDFRAFLDEDYLMSSQAWKAVSHKRRTIVRKNRADIDWHGKVSA